MAKVVVEEREEAFLERTLTRPFRRSIPMTFLALQPSNVESTDSRV